MKSFQTLPFINIQAYPHEFSTEPVIPIKKKIPHLQTKKATENIGIFSTPYKEPI